MRRKIFGCMLIGCLMLGLSACGDVKVATTDENGSTQVTTVPVEEVIEEMVESIEEEAEHYVWSERIHEMFKPAFDASPIFKGEALIGKYYEDVVDALGEPTMPDSTNDALGYDIQNSAGTGIQVRISSGYVGEEILNTDEFRVLEYNLPDEYFDVDNENYAISHEKCLELQKLKLDLLNEGKKLSSTGYTYEDIVEMIGTPGFIMAVEIDNFGGGYVTIRWVNPEGDKSVGERYLEFGFNLDGSII